MAGNFGLVSKQKWSSSGLVGTILAFSFGGGGRECKKERVTTRIPEHASYTEAARRSEFNGAH